MLVLIQKADIVIDMHTSFDSPAFMVVSRCTQEAMTLAEVSPIKPIVVYESKRRVAMVDYVLLGIGVELGTHLDSKARLQGVDLIKCYLAHFGMIETQPGESDHEYYRVVGKISQDEAEGNDLYGKLKDFETTQGELIGFGPDVFYPVLVCGPEASSVHCLVTRKVVRRDLLGKNKV